jgi:hypothetical protein
MMRLRIAALSALAVAAALSMFPGAAPAYWSAYLYNGTEYGIREGDNFIPLGLTEKEATRTAKKVNKALAKDKAESGFVDTGEGPCADPNSGVLC